MSNNDLVIIDLDRPRELRFTYTALKTLTAMTGKSLEELDGNIDISNFESIETMMYCGLLKDAKDNKETLTLDQIPELLDEAKHYAYVIEKVLAAFRAAFGEEKNPEGNQEPPVEQPEEKRKTSTGKKI